MRRSVASCCAQALERRWVHAAEPPPGARVRVLHFNTLADCLAKAAPESGQGPHWGFRCGKDALQWDHRAALLRQEILQHSPDIVSLCEVDRHSDFFEPALDEAGYEGVFRKKRPPARDGVALFWRRSLFAGALRRTIFLEQGKRTRAAQVALLQRLCFEGGEANGRSVLLCTTHLRARASADALRMQQAAEVVEALADFAREGEPRIILADLNSPAPTEAEACGGAASVYEYLTACGYRCAYRAVGAAAAPGEVDADDFPAFTTWAGWSTGDYRAVCDHIFVSQGVRPAAALDVPDVRAVAAAFPERLPNVAYPSDHISLVVDLSLAY